MAEDKRYVIGTRYPQVKSRSLIYIVMGRIKDSEAGIVGVGSDIGVAYSFAANYMDAQQEYFDSDFWHMNPQMKAIGSPYRDSIKGSPRWELGPSGCIGECWIETWEVDSWKNSQATGIGTLRT